MYIVQSTRYEIRGTELKISNAEFRFLNEEVENILLLESPTWYLVLGTWYKNFIFALEMKSNAANLIFSLPAQVQHLVHHFHHSS